MFIKGLVIPVFYSNEESEQNDKLEIQYPYTDCDVRKDIFYTIDFVSTFIDTNDNNKVYGSIYSGGTAVVSPLKKKELQELVEKHIEECLKLEKALS